MSRSLPAVMPKKRADVLTADFETELVVLVPEQRRAHRLDEGLSLVLDGCDGVTAPGHLVAEVAAATGQPADQVEVWLAAALEQLGDIDVLEPT